MQSSSSYSDRVMHAFQQAPLPNWDTYSCTTDKQQRARLIGAAHVDSLTAQACPCAAFEESPPGLNMKLPISTPPPPLSHGLLDPLADTSISTAAVSASASDVASTHSSFRESCRSRPSAAAAAYNGQSPHTEGISRASANVQPVTARREATAFSEDSVSVPQEPCRIANVATFGFPTVARTPSPIPSLHGHSRPSTADGSTNQSHIRDGDASENENGSHYYASCDSFALLAELTGTFSYNDNLAVSTKDSESTRTRSPSEDRLGGANTQPPSTSPSPTAAPLVSGLSSAATPQSQRFASHLTPDATAALAAFAAPSLFSTNPRTLGEMWQVLARANGVRGADRSPVDVATTTATAADGEDDASSGTVTAIGEEVAPAPLPEFYRRATRMLADLLPEHCYTDKKSRRGSIATAEKDLGLDDFFHAFFVEEQWFTRESLTHSLCLINRMTRAHPEWWREVAVDEDGEPVPIMPSEREAQASGDNAETSTMASHVKPKAAALFTRASMPRALLALLLLSSKFVDDVTYNTGSICGAMARLRDRQKAREFALSTAASTTDLVETADFLLCSTGALAWHSTERRFTRHPSSASALSSTASLHSLGAASSTCSMGNTVVYPVLKPARLGQCEQRMFALLEHSVWVKKPEYDCCLAMLYTL